MRAIVIALCTWLLIASGSYFAVRGLLEYREAHTAQDQIAQEWQDRGASDPEPPAASVLKPRSSPAPPPGEPRLQRSAPVVTGAAVAKLSIPSLGTVLYVVEGTRDHDLKRGPGHLMGTVLPGEVGNCVIAGHRDTHFRVLRNIHQGDEVILERAGQRFRYRVNGMKIVSPKDTASLQPTAGPELNLITCYPFHYVGSAPKRFIVHADLEGSPLEAAR